VSAVVLGGGTTVGVIVEVADEPPESVMLYATGVAVPVNAPVHDAPAGVLAAEHGVNTTFPPERVYTPCPGTVFDVNEQPDAGESVMQKVMVGDVRFFPVDARSFAFTLIVCVAPCAPVDVSAVATAGVLYAAFTTAFTPAAITAVGDTRVFALRLELPEPPLVTVAVVAVCVPASANFTL
jgi:hypothetical protein